MEMRRSDLSSPLTDNKVNSFAGPNSGSLKRAEYLRRPTRKPANNEPLFNNEESGPQLWTVSDQMRIRSMDRLQSRTLEYHNNVHQRIGDSPDARYPSPQDIVADLLFCVPGVIKQPNSVTTSMMPKMLQQHRDNTVGDASSFLWVNLFSLSTLPRLAQEFDMSNLIVVGFEDMRCHSGVVQSADGSCLISLCYFHMHPMSFHVQMFKIYCYMNKGVLITYIAELMPDDFEKYDDESDVNDTTVCSTVMSKWPKLSNDVVKYGPFFLFYKLAEHCLLSQDPIMEFFSRTLFFFKSQIKVRLSHHEKINFMKKMHIVMSGVHLLDRNTQKLVYIFESLSSKISNPKVLPLISSDILSTEVLPFMFDLQDLFHFADDCLNSLEIESQLLHKIMEDISTLRANNNAVSIVYQEATIINNLVNENDK